jgi:ABC transporter substrate binding protein
MRRREFIGLLGATALSFPRPGHAQTKNDLPVVGLLLPQKPDTTVAKDRITALRKGLEEAGFVEGTNYSLAARFAEGDLGRYPELAKELSTLKSRAIVMVGLLPRVVLQSIPDVPTRYRLPTIYLDAQIAKAGGLVSYSSDKDEDNRILGRYVGRILKGAKPADIPVMQSTKTIMAINLKTAKALGIEVPKSLLARADEVIE